jgi:ABC-type multidrug transport system fused ATPase/permease subunit
MLIFSNITKVAEEKLGNIRTVHSFAKEQQEAKVFGDRAHEVFLLAKKEVFIFITLLKLLTFIS